MQKFHNFLVLLLPLLLLPLIISDVVEGSLAGRWEPIKDISDPHVTEIAEFAVDEYNKRVNTGLKLVVVVSGESQVVSGMNYRLILTATDGTATKAYKAIVWENALLKKELTSFEPLRLLS
ncbi:hypothetical protein V6N13_084691 [Hibiscus sabdariffa]|uniref:Cystatin domain-containing protein n=1 Tax=Hibiscus sabdariffa TaxID=183260 RepID=A0ABR2T1R9_9ROSI